MPGSVRFLTPRKKNEEALLVKSTTSLQTEIPQNVNVNKACKIFIFF